MTKIRIALMLFIAVAPVWAADVSGNWRLIVNANGVPELVALSPRRTSDWREGARPLMDQEWM
jgi:hypothetical protein